MRTGRPYRSASSCSPQLSYVYSLVVYTPLTPTVGFMASSRRSSGSSSRCSASTTRTTSGIAVRGLHELYEPTDSGLVKISFAQANARARSGERLVLLRTAVGGGPGTQVILDRQVSAPRDALTRSLEVLIKDRRLPDHLRVGLVEHLEQVTHSGAAGTESAQATRMQELLRGNAQVAAANASAQLAAVSVPAIPDRTTKPWRKIVTPTSQDVVADVTRSSLVGASSTLGPAAAVVTSLVVNGSTIRRIAEQGTDRRFEQELARRPPAERDQFRREWEQSAERRKNACFLAADRVSFVSTDVRVHPAARGGLQVTADAVAAAGVLWSVGDDLAALRPRTSVSDIDRAHAKGRLLGSAAGITVMAATSYTADDTVSGELSQSLLGGIAAPYEGVLAASGYDLATTAWESTRHTWQGLRAA